MNTLSFRIADSEMWNHRDIRKKFLKNLPPMYSNTKGEMLHMERCVDKIGYNVMFEIHRLMEGNQYLLF